MAVLSTLGTEVDLVGTAGLPFALTVEFTGASPFAASAIDEVTLAVLRTDTGAVVPAQPSFSEASAGVWVAEWSAALTAAMGTGTWRVAVEATYAGAGPFPVCSGILRWSPRGTPGANTSTTLEVTANLAGNTVSVDVSLVVVEGASSLDELSDVQITGTPGAGSILRHNGTRFVNVTGTDHFDAAGAAAAAVSAHAGAADPHPGYLTAAEGVAAFDPLGAADAVAAGLGTAAAANVEDFAADDDPRLSDARTPTAHAATHATAGGDAITPADIGAASAGHNHDGVYDPAGTAAALVDDLSGVSDASAARTNLGLGSAAVEAASAFASAGHDHDGDYLPMPSSGTLAVGKVAKVTDDSPLTLGWADDDSGGGGSDPLDGSSVIAARVFVR